jgi:hypothetical protein
LLFDWVGNKVDQPVPEVSLAVDDLASGTLEFFGWQGKKQPI